MACVESNHPGSDMVEVERITKLESKLREAQQKLQKQKDEFERANEEARRKLSGETNWRELRRPRMTFLNMLKMSRSNSKIACCVLKWRLRAAEKARDEECDRMQEWIDDLEERFCAESR